MRNLTDRADITPHCASHPWRVMSQCENGGYSCPVCIGEQAKGKLVQGGQGRTDDDMGHGEFALIAVVLLVITFVGSLLAVLAGHWMFGSK